ncbi:MAG: CoA transferase [Chloroflexi bacterium]|nr:CoA transferase [Chloroflexota bacterium]
MQRESPLSGIRVVDLSRVFAMPYVGAYLADMGAEVIKIDTHHAAFIDTTRTLTGPYPDNDPGKEFWNRAGTYQTLNRGKRSLTLDLRSEPGMAILLDLISISDVVLENFTPRVTRRFGLDYPSLQTVRPDLVLVSNTGYGHSGPWSDFGAMASALEPTHGAGAFMGYLEPDAEGTLVPSETPNKIGNSYTDFLACWSAQMAIMAALYRRALTGQGTWIDLAMYQNGVSFLGEGLLDYAFNCRSTRRLGNRHESMSPQGCYPCQGQDRWVVLTVRHDQDWQAFCNALGQTDLAADSRFADPISRHRHQDQLDKIITAWTGSKTQEEVVAILQSYGIPAAPVLDGEQMLSDQQLRSRGLFETVEHPESSGIGRREYLGRGWKLSEADVSIRGPAPNLGEANDYVLEEVLGLSDSQVKPLKGDGVIGEELAGGSAPGVVPLQRQAELGWIADYRENFLP